MTGEQVEYLAAEVDSSRDVCIVWLLYDSGMRLSELAGVNRTDFDWDTCTVTVIGKGNKQRRAPFTERTARLLQQYLGDNHSVGSIWGLGTSLREVRHPDNAGEVE